MELPVFHRYGLNPQFPEVIDSSMLRDFVDCPSKFYLRHVLGLKKKHVVYVYFDWGTMWHRMQEVFNMYLAQEGDRAGATVAALTVLEDEWPSSIDPATDKHKRSKERMAKIFLEYLQRWEKQESELEVVRQEQFFDLFHEELGIRWAGRIDRIVRRKKTSAIVVWDYKTSSSMGPRYFDSHELGFQIPGYVWAANQMFTDQIVEVCLDVTYTLTASHDFFRRSFRYIPHRIVEWQENIKRILDHMYWLRDNYLYEPEMWVKNWNDCTRYGMCQFWDVHSTPSMGDTRLLILQNDYTEERWDPRNQEDSVE